MLRMSHTYPDWDREFLEPLQHHADLLRWIPFLSDDSVQCEE